MNANFTMKDGRVVIVRSYDSGDFEALVFMFQHLSEEALRYGLPSYDRPRLERWVSGLRGGIILLALDGKRVIGVAVVFGRSNPRLKGVGEFFTYIHQEYHGKGLGTFLARTILEEVKRRGFHRVTLQVVADNAGAVKAYERAGFVHEGRLKDAFFDDDESYHDELIMGIIL
jgi:RimJ/RimL family protein N-acetyltransferase